MTCDRCRNMGKTTTEDVEWVAEARQSLCATCRYAWKLMFPKGDKAENLRAHAKTIPFSRDMYQTRFPKDDK